MRRGWFWPRRAPRATASAALLQALTLREHRLASPSLPPLQGVTSIESVKRQGDRKRDDQINRHGDGHHLHRRLRLVEDRPGENLYEVRITDKHGERGILDDVQILRCERRRYESHRLRDYHQPHR